MSCYTYHQYTHDGPKELEINHSDYADQSYDRFPGIFFISKLVEYKGHFPIHHYLHSDGTLHSTTNSPEGKSAGWYKSIAACRRAIQNYILLQEQSKPTEPLRCPDNIVKAAQETKEPYQVDPEQFM